MAKVIAVVGLGQLGGAIAERIHSRGYTVIGVDREAEARTALAVSSPGAVVAGSLEEAEVDLDAVDRLLLIVRLTSQAESILRLLQDRSVGRSGEPLEVLILTTLQAGFAERLGQYGTDGLKIVESPVSGGARAAVRGELTALLAGQDLDGAEEFLEATIASHVFRFLGYGQPTSVKLANNTLVAYNAVSLSKVMQLVAAAGIPSRQMLDAIVVSSGGGYAAEHFRELMLDLLEKDVDLLVEQFGELPAVRVVDGEFRSQIVVGRELLAVGAEQPSAVSPTGRAP